MAGTLKYIGQERPPRSCWIVFQNTTVHDCTDNIIKVPNDKLVVLQGLQGYIVVENEGTLLICKKEDEQKIKQFVADLKTKGKTDKV